MISKTVARLAVAGLACGALSVLSRAAGPAGPVEFVAHDIATDFRGGYAVSVADFNKDGKIDVIANTLAIPELAWYENPTWEKHVIVTDTPQIVNEAVADIDGDGIPEVVFQSGFAMQAANSPGFNWIARSGGNPKQSPWKAEKIDTFPTSHHVAWLDLDGDGKKELLNAPLIGEKSFAPTYDQDKASVFWYSPSDWKRHTVTTDIPGIIHRVRPVKWDNNGRDQFLVASFEGIALYRPTGKGYAMMFEKTLLSHGHEEKAPRLGASDVGVGKQDGRRFFASIEPWHGNEVVIYTQNGNQWTRRVIYDKLTSGHEIAVVDLNGDGRDDIVANDNSQPSQRNPNAPAGGVHVFYAPADPATGTWQDQRVEDKAAMNSCVGADVNGDGRMDIVCTGAGGVIRWYENKGPARQSTAGK